MRAPAFWWRRPGLASALLSPVGAVVGAVALRRMGGTGARVDAPVLCVGNPTVGGAGKTPTAIALLRRLNARGATPFALLRGHGGTARMPLRVDPAIHDAGTVGDEALLLARHAPTVVAGGQRRAGADLAVAAGASHIVMDDGFQNPSLAKDVSVLVVDGTVGVGTGGVTPAGPLRAPLGPQLARADAVLVVGDGAAGAEVAARAGAAGCAVLTGRLVPDPAAVAALRGVPLIAFAGIGRPEKFFATLEEAGLAPLARHAFADHHPFRPAEIARLAQEAKAQGARLVTTEKDKARLAGPAFAALAGAIATLPVALALDDPGALDALIDRAEARWRARRGRG
ncbi:tetraacyldisaccharide 4'-kinase [Xanthobacter autotrophicus]|uniref:tetraacyldisaccharide 4'-kinase n=1 Tax=Xanthobacter TaxID=279 RepID=UPI0024AA22FB|nr:tetraacyldisaccharide 4'-kinase [Xanthobacter autotrophicus]MDI4666433.1 tetraacyldisaccharide 4'-kinase [Xanthobacter autotrophicus]